MMKTCVSVTLYKNSHVLRRARRNGPRAVHNIAVGHNGSHPCYDAGTHAETFLGDRCEIR